MAFPYYLCTIVLLLCTEIRKYLLTGTWKPVMSTTLSLLREIVLSVPLTIILPRFFGVTGTSLFCTSCSQLVSFIVVIIFSRYVLNHLGEKTEKEN
jgi:Na+-driven multidrug efflux pump